MLIDGQPHYPLLLEINACPWLKSLSEKYRQPLTLGIVPDAELKEIAEQGFHAIWLMGIWERSARAREIASSLDFLKKEYYTALTDFCREDVTGSPYAVKNYRVDPALGDAEQLAQFREKLHQYNMRLILDFVPNHLAIDHEWLNTHPERLIQGTELNLKITPEHYFLSGNGSTARIFAYGRAPFASPWTDTVQLDYRRAGTRQAMLSCLLTISSLCDGVRCDMAMLLLEDLFLKTWHGKYEKPAEEFWALAIAAVKTQYPDFLFIGEVYWDYEYEMQKLGFDFVYDKVLYDRVLGRNPRTVYDHLSGGSIEFQAKLVRFIENHDEKRVASLVSVKQNLAAATLIFTLPGMHLVHEGQTDGYRIKLPVQLGRRLPEAADPVISYFYKKLFAAIRTPLFQEGNWELLQPRPAAPDNSSFNRLIACLWRWHEEIGLVIVNLSREAAQCFLPLCEKTFTGKSWYLEDQLRPFSYIREGNAMADLGLFLDIQGFGYHLFIVRPYAQS